MRGTGPAGPSTSSEPGEGRLPCWCSGGSDQKLPGTLTAVPGSHASACPSPLQAPNWGPSQLQQSSLSWGKSVVARRGGSAHQRKENQLKPNPQGFCSSTSGTFFSPLAGWWQPLRIGRNRTHNQFWLPSPSPVPPPSKVMTLHHTPGEDVIHAHSSSSSPQKSLANIACRGMLPHRTLSRDRNR